MASQDASIADIQNQLKEAVCCIICAEIYHLPKILPCHHTFCLKCLEDMGSAAHKIPGNTMLCPVCRKEFAIPVGGFVNLQHDFKTEALMEMSNLAESVILCDQHENRQLDIYCYDCQVIVCSICYINAHKTHHGVDVGVAAGGFRQQIQERIVDLETCCMEGKQRKEFISKSLKEMILHFEELAKSANARKKELLATIDSSFIVFISKIESLKKAQTEKLENELTRVDGHILSLGGILKNSRDFLKNGSAIICNSVRDLKKQATEMQKSHEDILLRPVNPIQYSFQKTDLNELFGTENFFGTIKNTQSAALPPRSKTELLQDLMEQIEALKQIIKDNKAQISQLRISVDCKNRELNEEKSCSADIFNENSRLKEDIERHKRVHQKRQDSMKKMREKNDCKIAQLKITIEKLNNVIENEKRKYEKLHRDLETHRTLNFELRRNEGTLDHHTDELIQESHEIGLAERGGILHIDRCKQEMKGKDGSNRLDSGIDELLLEKFITT